MKRSILKSFLVLGVVMAFVSCKKEEPKAAVIDINQIKEEIQAKENEFADTYNSGIVKDIKYYDIDAITYPQNREPLVGRDAIVAYFKESMSSNGNKLAFKTNEVNVSSDGNQVVELGYYTVKDSVGTIVNSGNYMSLFVKKEGSYVCLRDMNASDKPE